MFEKIFNGITEFFDDVLPDEFCVPCFLKGRAEGLLIGVTALAVIAAAPAWLAVALTVGLAVVGVYGMAQLAHNWGNMSDTQKSEALGGIVGGLLAGRFGPKLPPKPMMFPGVRYLTTPEGVMVPVVVATETAVPVAAGGAVAAPVAGTGVVAMASSGGAGGGGGQGEDDEVREAERTEPAQPPRKYQPTQKHEKGGWGTEMDLPPETAQTVLDNGITGPNGSQIYGHHDRKLYEFQPDNTGGYHGYPVRGTEVPPKVLRTMKDNGTITNAEYNKFRKGQ